MLIDAALAVAFAVFVWWFATGLILLLDRLPKTTFRWSLVLSSGLALAALAGIARTAGQDSAAAAYCAFTCALLVWGWHELSFLTGWITGPRRVSLDGGAAGTRRLVQALQVILWHELGLLAAGALVFALTWGAANPTAGWTFAVLWAMRASAKLNLFLGVRNVGDEYLPAHLGYLESYFRRRPMNALFPVSVAVSTVAAALLVLAALDPAASAGARTGGLLVATMLALGVVEHWMLVLPMPAGSLWRWAMRGPAAPPVLPAEAAVVVPVEAKEPVLHAR